jgi:hypothetical protein
VISGAEATCLRAAEILGERGWSRRTSFGPRGEVCAATAVFLAGVEEGDDDPRLYVDGGADANAIWPLLSPAQEAALELLEERVRALGVRPDASLDHPLVAYNDDPGRTEDEVLALLEGRSIS